MIQCGFTGFVARFLPLPPEEGGMSGPGALFMSTAKKAAKR